MGWWESISTDFYWFAMRWGKRGVTYRTRGSIALVLLQLSSHWQRQKRNAKQRWRQMATKTACKGPQEPPRRALSDFFSVSTMLENEGRCLGSLKKESKMRSSSCSEQSIPSTGTIWSCHLRIRFDQNKLLAINKKCLLIPAGFHKSSKFWTGIFRNWEPSVLKCNGSHYLQMVP